MELNTAQTKQHHTLLGWSTRDILVTAVISLMAGVLGLVMIPLLTISLATLGPLAANALGGYIAVVYMLAPIIVRRPLVALVGALISSLAQVPFSPYGLLLVISGLIIGVLYELGFAVTRYRSYTMRTIIVIAAVVQVIGVFPSAAANGYFNVGAGFLIAILITAGISGAIGGWLTFLLALALGRTGVLQGTAAGQTIPEV